MTNRMSSKINIDSTKLLRIFVLCHAIWLGGRTDAAVTPNIGISSTFRIKHKVSGKYIRPEEKDDEPLLKVSSTIDSYNDMRFQMIDAQERLGYLVHIASNKIVHPRGLSENAELILVPDRTSQALFSYDKVTNHIQHASGKYIHPLGGSGDPAYGTNMVLHSHVHNRMEFLFDPIIATGESTEVSCGGAFDTVPGEFQHPITSGSYYNSNEICTWTISSSLPLTFYFSKFNMEADYDHLSLRDGGSVGSSLISKLTGKSLHYNFTTAGNAHIQFESDPSVVGTGFVLHWRVYSAEGQCKDKNGFCVTSGNRCDGTFEMIQNTCDDLCTCCIPDTIDQGFCIDGVILGNQCFKFSTEQLSWEDAKEKCLFQNARLASLNDPLAFQEYARTNYGGEKFWVGGSDLANEGEFVWLNGNALGTQFPWPSTQPDNYRDEDCLLWGFEGSFNDGPCQRLQKFVCEH